jgi:hypothetical protein
MEPESPPSKGAWGMIHQVQSHEYTLSFYIGTLREPLSPRGFVVKKG